MSISAEKADEILDKTYERGNLTVAVGSRARKRKMRKLVQTADGTSISGDIFQAIDHYLQDKYQEDDDEPEMTSESERLAEKKSLATDPNFLRGDKN